MSSLRNLADRPFELLLQLDQQLRGARLDTAAEASDLWSGLAFRLGPHWLVAPKDDVREVIPPPRLSRVPNARPWLAGVANVRGNLLTLVHAAQLLGLEGGNESRARRVLVLNAERVGAGFVVEEVAGYRQFAAEDQRPVDRLQVDPSVKHFLLGGFVRDGRAWPVFSLHR
ncbi:MAG: chemotaxis protein CheW, partial [Panacagrimonas sp.]